MINKNLINNIIIKNSNWLAISVLFILLLLEANFIAGRYKDSEPSLFSSFPADGSENISIINDIYLYYSIKIDGSTVNEENIILKQADSNKKIKCVIKYSSISNNPNTVTISPQTPLSYDTTYSLTISGLKDGSGNKLLNNKIHYTTIIKPGSKNIFYADGIVTGYSVSAYDKNGNKNKYVNYKGSGPDGIWFSDDDNIYYYIIYLYNESGKKSRYILFTGAGEDSAWFTGDDKIDYYYAYEYDENGNQVKYALYTGSGADGIWFSNDDQAYPYFTNNEYDN